MELRELGRTGWRISPISFGAWAIGGDAWGSTDDFESMRSLHRAVDLGVNFIDTADVYGDGHSERLIGQLRRERKGEQIIVATKAGRRLKPHVAEGFTRENLTAFVERSLKNLDTDAIDLLQLHCPPPDVYDMPEVFGILDDLVTAGKLRYYGVSVERVEEALRAARHPNVQSVQIIFNMFRLKPSEELFPVVREKRIGILARVPLASGLLSGKLTRDSAFAPTDHRNYNRHGESFDVGETFSGVDYDAGLQAVDELRSLVPKGASMAQLALRWILMFPEVSAAIPGARNVQQTEDNVRAAELSALSDADMARVREIYDRYVRAGVHSRW
ncbi:MAG: putative oxidoreductase, aryl-alcohol dehydrogenase like protein [Gemmatimonadetes bacterium]|nr:putative oxidoreductase, aryl-alcohol dehydrogenase like protein [Gemmatimonadota bacterium]